jgi:hypothetical protein
VVGEDDKEDNNVDDDGGHDDSDDDRGLELEPEPVLVLVLGLEVLSVGGSVVGSEGAGCSSWFLVCSGSFAGTATVLGRDGPALKYRLSRSINRIRLEAVASLPEHRHTADLEAPPRLNVRALIASAGVAQKVRGLLLVHSMDASDINPVPPGRMSVVVNYRLKKN